MTLMKGRKQSAVTPEFRNEKKSICVSSAWSDREKYVFLIIFPSFFSLPDTSCLVCLYMWIQVLA